MPSSPVTPECSTRCPLCGGGNDCRMAAGGDPAQPCWCERERFSPALLRRLPPQQDGGRSCICPRCVQAQRDVHPGGAG